MQVTSQLWVWRLVDLPDVGKNLSVMIMLNLGYFVNSTDTFDDVFRNVTLRDELFLQWNETGGTGLLGTSGSHSIYTRLSSNSTIFGNSPDPAAGPNTAHIQSGISVSAKSVVNLVSVSILVHERMVTSHLHRRVIL